MAEHTSLSDLFGDIADAIRAKTGDTNEIVADEFPDAIAAISTGGGSTVRTNGVVFIDIDGSEVEYWAPSEVAGKTELPDLPTHSNLNVKGWSSDIETIQDGEYASSLVQVALNYSNVFKVSIHHTVGFDTTVLRAIEIAGEANDVTSIAIPTSRATHELVFPADSEAKYIDFFFYYYTSSYSSSSGSNYNPYVYIDDVSKSVSTGSYPSIAQVNRKYRYPITKDARIIISNLNSNSGSRYYYSSNVFIYE